MKAVPGTQGYSLSISLTGGCYPWHSQVKAIQNDGFTEAASTAYIRLGWHYDNQRHYSDQCVSILKWHLQVTSAD